MNGPLVDAAKKILKREYGVECTEPFAGVDRFRRRTGNTVAQVDLEGMNGGSVYKLRLCGFCYDNDEKYEEEKQIKPTESANPKGLAEIIDEYLSKVETNLHILIKMHRPYSKKKRIMSLDEAKELLENAGITVEDTLESKSQLADNTIHSIWLELEKYFAGKGSRYFKYDEIETMRKIMISVSEYAQTLCELNGSSCNLETLKQLIKSEYDANHISKK